MPTIREVKTELRHSEWSEQIRECQSRGMTVVAWCKANEISPYTYYFRLKMVWKELLKRAETPLQQIVPLSISPNVLGSSAQISVQTPCIESACVESETLESSEVATMQSMIVRKNWDRFTIKDEHT